MAVEKTLAKRTLSINVKDGVSTNGSDKFKAYSYSKVKEGAAEADIFAVGTAIAGLMDKEVSDISVTEKSILTEVM